MTFWSILRQRCWGLVLVVAGVCVITFIISHLIPGDPARLLAGDRASDAIVENIRQQLGLDQPLYVQFYRYVSDLFHGDLGTSIRTGRPVLEELRIFFPATLELAFCALLLALLLRRWTSRYSCRYCVCLNIKLEPVELRCCSSAMIWPWCRNCAIAFT